MRTTTAFPDSFLHRSRFCIALICLAELNTSPFPLYALKVESAEVFESQELTIATQSGKPKGLFCDVEALQILELHRKNKAPLEPSDQLPPVNNAALLGLMVQIRGESYVQDDLEFQLVLRFRAMDRIYRGLWPQPKAVTEKSRSRVYAKTTDWWINLDKLFSKNEIADICKDSQQFVVLYHSHNFRSHK